MLLEFDFDEGAFQLLGTECARNECAYFLPLYANHVSLLQEKWRVFRSVWLNYGMLNRHLRVASLKSKKRPRSTISEVPLCRLKAALLL